jgi:hypothetical protein
MYQSLHIGNGFYCSYIYNKNFRSLVVRCYFAESKGCIKKIYVYICGTRVFVFMPVIFGAAPAPVLDYHNFGSSTQL